MQNALTTKQSEDGRGHAFCSLGLLVFLVFNGAHAALVNELTPLLEHHGANSRLHAVTKPLFRRSSWATKIDQVWREIVVRGERHILLNAR